MYHFIGIKGSGMSALAQLMHKLGYTVQGSDVSKYFFTEEGLHDLEIPVLPFAEANIKEGMKIVRGATYHEENVEVARAMELNLPIYSYAEMVGILTKKFKTITIAGCHGKTTTTSMMAHVFGGLVGSNYLIGDGTGDGAFEHEYFILEACEYRRHFLNYSPYIAIITNIDLDHVDYFKDIDDVIDAYQEYANKAEKMVLACGDDPYTHALEVSKPIFYYGLDEDNDIRAENIEYKTTGTSFEVSVEGNYYGYFDLPIYGKHMLLDALAVIATCYYERLEAKDVAKLFKTFEGAKRRFTETVLGEMVVIDDYAHHPNEVRATLKAVKQKYPEKTIVTIFQPHTFSRTAEFAEDLAKVMNQADYSYILPIHPAREKQEDYEGVTSSLIVDLLEHGSLLEMTDVKKLEQYSNAVLLFMSPNDLSTLEQEVISYYQEQVEKKSLT